MTGARLLLARPDGRFEPIEDPTFALTGAGLDYLETHPMRLTTPRAAPRLIDLSALDFGEGDDDAAETPPDPSADRIPYLRGALAVLGLAAVGVSIAISVAFDVILRALSLGWRR